MNWKEAPHLFANGKFKLEYKRCVTGWSEGQGFYDQIKKSHTNLNHNNFKWVKNNIDDFTLIARKIEDMTDEEIKESPLVFESNDLRKLDIKNNGLRFHEGIYLLSIGVYPLDQEAFETGEVLDAKEVL